MTSLLLLDSIRMGVLRAVHAVQRSIAKCSTSGLDLPGRMDLSKLSCVQCPVSCVRGGGGGVGGWKQREVEERGGRERGEPQSWGAGLLHSQACL